MMELPGYQEFSEMENEQIFPFYQMLEDRSLHEHSLSDWMSDWSSLRKLVDERYARLQLANAQNTTNQEAEKRYFAFLQEIYPVLEEGDQKLKLKLLNSGLIPEGMELPLRKMQMEVDLFREENLPLMAEERKLGSEYNKIIGNQTVEWEGEELTLTQVKSTLQSADRDTRQKLWLHQTTRQLQDRQEINHLWQQLMKIRKQLAKNSGKRDYREFRWQQQLRMDYSPQDSLSFLKAILERVVPAASRIYRQHQHRFNIGQVQPWDLLENRSTFLLPAESLFTTEQELISKVGSIFNQVDHQLGSYYQTMVEKDLLDLMNRKGKGPGAFCTSFATQNLPFIFMNAVGQRSDLRVLFHEAGHAFHVFERSKLPFHHQWRAGMEFNEVASTAMELLATFFVEEDEGGFLSAEQAARMKTQLLEEKLLFWPYMAVVVAFQHWVYENHHLASNPDECDRKWSALVDSYLPGVDWSEWEDAKKTGWQRKLHIHKYPFYYIEYGLAALGAFQIWINAENDLEDSIHSYRQALALGGTASLPELYQAAGANFSFDNQTIIPIIERIESALETMQRIL